MPRRRVAPRVAGNHRIGASGECGAGSRAWYLRVVSSHLLSALRELLGDRYAIERELGRGGMGAVYLARDRQLDRPVALKVLPPDIAIEPGLRDRFLRETRLVAGFSHPNIVPVFAVEESPTLLAFAMGFVEGESLTARVQRAGPLSSRETVRLMQDIGYALAYAHGRGVVHRDLKPDNIMIERATGRALLMDFGIARAIETPAARQGLTRVGEVVGTPEFMSPEQASGDVVDGRSDLYALGLVLYFALTGTMAITGESTQRVIVAQLTQAVPSVGLARSDLPSALVDVIDRCVQKEPSARFASAEALVEALDAAQLSAPEVALPVREFARDLDSVPVVLLVGLVIMDLMYEGNEARGWELNDGLTSMTVIAAIMGARFVQVAQARRRLTTLGFDGGALHAGLVQLLEERAAFAAALRAQPGYLRRQRWWLAIGVALLPLAHLLGQIGVAGRTQLSAVKWYVPPWAQALFYLDSALTGVGLVLVARSPLAAGRDRFFRALWLGPLGRRLLGLTEEVRVGRTVPPTAALTPRPPVTLSQPTLRPAPAPGETDSPDVTAATPDVAALRRALDTIDVHVRALESRQRE